MSRFFALFALGFATLAYLWPAPFAPLRPAIVPLLGVVMFGMGISLSPDHFARVFRRPGALGFGLALQFGLMPLIAWIVARALALPVELAAGLILVGSCPGGTASNVICYLARADVALSISLTTLSTLLAVVATPLLMELYAGRSVDVDVPGMILSITRVVLVPVALGVAANRLLGPRAARLARPMPLVSMAAIGLIIAIIVALGRDELRELSAPLAAAVVLHNGLGMALGYAVARLARRGESGARTLAIEVGMQNSGLAVALAVEFLSPLAALPGALFSIWHNLSGATLASWWSRRPPPS